MRTAIACIIAAALLAPAVAEARSEKVVAWELTRVFPTAVRFLRIDEGVVIVEKDAEAGYVLFDLKEEGKTFRGALELVSFQKDGRESVRLILRIEDRPEYVEVGMLDRLERKLRGEHGAPPRPEKKDPPRKDTAKEPPRAPEKDAPPPVKD
jgi:hypothetical protein